MEVLLNKYVEFAELIISQNGALSTDKLGFFESFSRTKLNKFKNKIPEFYDKNRGQRAIVSNIRRN